MNLESFMNPTVVTITIIMVFVLILQLWIDRLRMRQLPKVRLQHSDEIAQKHKISVIVPLSRRAESLFDTLDHLRAQNYEQLEVVVVVWQTAGKNAASTLRRYRRKHSDLSLRIVKHKKGMDSRVVASRYARGEVVMELEPSHRLSPGFFAQASAHFNVASLDELHPIFYKRAGNSITSGLEGWTVVFQNIRGLFSRKSVTTLRIVRRAAFVKNEVSVSRNDTNIIVQVSELPKPAKHQSSHKQAVIYRFVIAASLVVVSYGAVAVSLLPVATQLVVGSVLIGYMLLLVLLLASYRGVSVWQKLNLAVLVPFTPLLLVYSTLKRN